MEDTSENKSLFDECVEALDVRLLSENEVKRLYILFWSMYPMTNWGKVDWDNIEKKRFLGFAPDFIIPFLKELLGEQFDKTAYVKWSTAGIPIIKTDLDSVFNFFEDVSSVSFETFIFNPSSGYIVEVRSDGEITVGILSQNQIIFGQKVDAFLDAFSNDVEVPGDVAYILGFMKHDFGFGKDLIAWDKIIDQITLNSPNKIKDGLGRLINGKLDSRVYILWGNHKHCAFESNLDLVLQHWDKIQDIGTNFYLMSKQTQYVIEVNEQNIKVGLKPKRN